MRSIGGPRLESGTPRSEATRSGCIELWWSENAGRQRFECIARTDEYGALRRVFVVHICDRDTHQAEVVESWLARRGFIVDVSEECGLDGIVRDPGIVSVSGFVAASKYIDAPALE